MVPPRVEAEAGGVGGAGRVSPEEAALGEVRSAVAGVTEARGAGEARGEVEVRGAVGGGSVTELWQVTLPGCWPALGGGGSEGAEGEVTAPALGTHRARGQAAGLWLAAGVGTVTQQPTVTVLPGLSEPIATHGPGEYLKRSSTSEI